MPITIVSGKPGAGKTAYLAAQAFRFMNGSPESITLMARCRATLNMLNARGGSFKMPEFPPVYSNFPITVSLGSLPPVESYYIDGFHFGFKNEFVPVMPVLPGSVIILSEAQRYYNSRKSKDLPDWVSRIFEQHRHFDLTIFLDVQRPGLIDVNIRELCDRFVEVQYMENKTDKAGNILSSTFHLREFDDWRDVDAYLSSGAHTYRETTYVHEGCVFDCYESRAYFDEFIPSVGDFYTELHPHDQDAIAKARKSQQMYSQTPPDGFYGGSKKTKREVNRDAVDTA